MFCQLLILTLLIVSAQSAVIREGADLGCGFESLCAGWRNGTNGIEDHSDWKVTHAVTLDAWHSIPRPAGGNQFAFVIGKSGQRAEFAWLVSEHIPCLLIPGYLTFSYWKNAFLSGLFKSHMPRLQVFLRQPPGSANLKFLAEVDEVNRWGWRYAVIELPQVDGSFEVIIQAEFQGPFDLIAIDELSFRGFLNEKYCHLSSAEKKQLLSSGLVPELSLKLNQLSQNGIESTSDQLITLTPTYTTEAATTTTAALEQNLNFEENLKTAPPIEPFTPETTAAPLIVFPTEDDNNDFESVVEATSHLPSIEVAPVLHLDDCGPINCGFEGDSCGFQGTDSDRGAWVIVQGRIGNPLTGITRAAFGRYYAVAYSISGSSTQVLRSIEFNTSEQSFLTFWYYFANANLGRIVVCDQSLDNCLWEKSRSSVSPDARRWRRGVVVLPAGKHQIMFVVENLRDHYYVGLDQVNLRRQLTGSLVPCQIETGA